jgi:hypothetical protein
MQYVPKTIIPERVVIMLFLLVKHISLKYFFILTFSNFQHT